MTIRQITCKLHWQTNWQVGIPLMPRTPGPCTLTVAPAKLLEISKHTSCQLCMYRRISSSIQDLASMRQPTEQPHLTKMNQGQPHVFGYREPRSHETLMSISKKTIILFGDVIGYDITKQDYCLFLIANPKISWDLDIGRLSDQWRSNRGQTWSATSSKGPQKYYPGLKH